VRQLIEKKRAEQRKVYAGLTCFKEGVRQIPIESIPGVVDAGWKPPEKGWVVLLSSEMEPKNM